MATIGRTPEGGGIGVSYTHDKVPKGSVRTGYLAGHVHGFITHRIGTSKPCTADLPGCDVPCAGCGRKAKREWTGYVPLRDHTGRPYVACIGAGAEPVVRKISPGSAVAWGRDSAEGSAVYVLEWKLPHRWVHYWPDTPPRADLSAWLCRLWAMPELLASVTALCSGECQGAVTDPDQDEVIHAHPPEAPPELVARVKGRGASAVGEKVAPAPFGEVLGKLTPKKNGSH